LTKNVGASEELLQEIRALQKLEAGQNFPHTGCNRSIRIAVLEGIFLSHALQK